MKLNKHIPVIAVSVLTVITSSCTSFIDKPTEGKVPTDSVDYTNVDNMYQPVSGVYAYVRSEDTHWAIYAITIIRDDDVWSGRNDDQTALVPMGNNYQYDNTYFGINEAWIGYYQTIKYANSAIKALDEYAANIKNPSDMATNKSYAGEVRFLRAYSYYRLVQLFGAVTILRSNDQVDLRRSVVDSVYNYALTDLQYAIDNCQRLRPNEMGHAGAVTAYSAEALAAKIYLNQGNYEKVQALTDDIINSGKFSLYPDYYELFKIPGKLCDESLFEIQTTDFGQGSGEAVGTNVWFGFQGPASFVGSTYGAGWGFIGLDKGAVGDPTKGFRSWARARGETVRYTTSFLEAGQTTPSGDVIGNQTSPVNTDCWNGKAYTPFNEMTPGRVDYGTNNNVRVLRYADVLLMNAEARVMQGQNGDAPFNLVRARANMPTLTNVTKEQIWDERRMELCAEWGERYNDLVRTGQATTVLGPNGWTAGKTYYPLPFTQLTNVPALAESPIGQE